LNSPYVVVGCSGLTCDIFQPAGSVSSEFASSSIVSMRLDRVGLAVGRCVGLDGAREVRRGLGGREDGDRVAPELREERKRRDEVGDAAALLGPRQALK
jgi:hypothetical protein